MINQQGKDTMRKILIFIALLATAMLSGCGIYSFSGTSIDYKTTKTVTIDYFQYKALKVNPSLSNNLTEALKDKFKKLTKLEEVDSDGDLELVGTVTGYEVRAAAVTADEVAAQNRLTVTVSLTFIDRNNPHNGFENKSFSAYGDYDSTNSLDAVESRLCEEIVQTLVEDMFNASVAQW